jgi:Trk K+ transport system NAD-binding subunit
LADDGHDVTVIDNNQPALDRLGKSFNGATLLGVAYDVDILRRAGLDSDDTFVAVTDSDNANLMAVEVAKSGVRRGAIDRTPVRPQTGGGLPDTRYVQHVTGTKLIANVVYEQVVDHEFGTTSPSPTATSRSWSSYSAQLPTASASTDLESTQQAAGGGGAPRRPHVHPQSPLRAPRGRPGGGGRPRGRQAPHSALPEAVGHLMRVIVMGGGKVGGFMARELQEGSHAVIVIEHNTSHAQQVAEETGALVIEGDGTDLELLEDIEIRPTDLFVAVTGVDEDNLVACQLVRTAFGVKKVLARLNDPRNRPTFDALRIPVVSVTDLLAQVIRTRARVR